MKEARAAAYQKMAQEMRKDMLRMGLKAGASGAHFGGSLSATEILAVLYSDILRLDTEHWENRDRFILSKGHCVMAQYAAMHQAGLITDEELNSFEDSDSWLFSHSTMNVTRGMEFSTGSLGQGLSLGVGTALALRRKGLSEPRTFVLMGDGECDEGQVWEAAMSAAHYKLNNLVAIIDANGMQVDGHTHEVLGQGDLTSKWSSFGWKAREVDGHDPEALRQVLTEHQDCPLAVIARTIKGKGISFMEHAVAWHHGRLGRKQFDLAMSELEGAR